MLQNTAGVATSSLVIRQRDDAVLFAVTATVLLSEPLNRLAFFILKQSVHLLEYL